MRENAEHFLNGVLVEEMSQPKAAECAQGELYGKQNASYAVCKRIILCKRL